MLLIAGSNPVGVGQVRGAAKTCRGPRPRERRRTARHARDYATTVFHPIGTCKMGIDPWPWSMRA